MRQIRFRNFENYFDPFFVFENNFRFEKLFLMPENKEFKPIEVKEGSEVYIWGVVTNVIHSV